MGKFAARTGLYHCWANEWTKDSRVFASICCKGRSEIEHRGPHRTCQWSIYEYLLLPSWNIPDSRGSVFFKFVSETQSSVLKCGKDCFLLWSEKNLRVIHGKEFLELEARKVRQNESKCQCFYSRVLRTPANNLKYLLIEVGIS